MGFLEEFTPLSWEESLMKLKYVREHGIEQFINIFHRVRHIQEDLLRWGDELEYTVLKLDGAPDDPDRKVKVSLRSKEIMSNLVELEEHGRECGLSEADMCTWMPEYGGWMVEATPRKPFEGITAILRVEDHMRLRRSRLLSVLEDGEIVPTMATFPMLGVGTPSDFVWDPHGNAGIMKTRGPCANSLFVPDEIINPHPRFRTLTKNIRLRRGENVSIRVPKFIDSNTFDPIGSCRCPASIAEADGMEVVYADAMAFGMGACCLQVTFQAANIHESRYLYDQLASFTPLMLALTAASPYLRGWLTEEDVRWNVVAQSVDDRTAPERGEGPVTLANRDPRKAGDGVTFLRKSRYGSINSYLCNSKYGTDPLTRTAWNNDLAMGTEKTHEDRLIKSGIDEILAKHIVGLFARDPLVIFKERVELDDHVFTDHWENIQSTNWQSVRWKPPHPERGMLDITSEEHIGWRVEFRTMEIQITDFENAAFTVFVVLMSRVLGALKLNTYIPISKLEENMRVACKRDAVINERFWVRINPFPPSISTAWASDDEFALLTIKDILLGTGWHAWKCAVYSEAEEKSHHDVDQPVRFCGYMLLIDIYLEFVGIDSVSRSKIHTYLRFIVGRATGEIKTAAQWIRCFILAHPSYQRDSRVPPDAAYDLAVAIKEIGEGIREAKDLIGDVNIPVCHTASNPLRNSSTNCLLRKYLRLARMEKSERLSKEVVEKKLQARIVMEELRELEEKRKSEKMKTLVGDYLAPPSFHGS